MWPMDELAIDDLKLFGRVAALGSLSAVARERDVPVSQVSRALSRIEKSCAARLVHRSTHGLTLSVEGETFLAYCQRIIGTFDELQGEFSSRAGAASGRVRVAASTVVAQYLLVPSLSELHRRHPRLSIDLEVSDRMADLVRDGLDIAIRTAAALPEHLVARRIGTLGRALYAAPSYAQANGLPARPDELAAHRLITNSAAPHLNHWPFVIEGQSSKHVAEGFWCCNDTGLAAEMVLQGLGIGRLSSIVAAPLLARGLLVPVLADCVDPQTVPLYAVMSSARQRLPKIRACIDFWAEQLGQQA